MDIVVDWAAALRSPVLHVVLQHGVDRVARELCRCLRDNVELFSWHRVGRVSPLPDQFLDHERFRNNFHLRDALIVMFV